MITCLRVKKVAKLHASVKKIQSWSRGSSRLKSDFKYFLKNHILCISSRDFQMAGANQATFLPGQVTSISATQQLHRCLDFITGPVAQARAQDKVPGQTGVIMNPVRRYFLVFNGSKKAPCYIFRLLFEFISRSLCPYLSPSLCVFISTFLSETYPSIDLSILCISLSLSLSLSLSHYLYDSLYRTLNQFIYISFDFRPSFIHVYFLCRGQSYNCWSFSLLSTFIVPHILLLKMSNNVFSLFFHSYCA